MKLYKVNFQLQGVLIFSTEVRPMISRGEAMGSYIAPLPYVHNYPIIYGLLGKSAEAYFVIPSMHQADYEERKAKVPRLKYTTVEEVLRNAKEGKGFYVFPLLPKKILTSSFLMSSESWSYGLPTRRPTKNVFPRLTSYTAFTPGSEFYTYMVTDDNFEIPEWIRIGKKRWGIMRVKAEELEIKEIKEEENCATSIPVNVRDTEYFDYKVLTQAKVLETPSIEEGIIVWATLDKCYSVLMRDQSISLPFPPGYLK